MANTILKVVNGRGIPCLESCAVAVTATGVTFSFGKHPYVGPDFSGLIAVKVDDSFTAPDTAVPIYFQTVGVAGSTLPLVELKGEAVTSDTWTGTGIHIVFYDRESNTLQLMY